MEDWKRSVVMRARQGLLTRRQTSKSLKGKSGKRDEKRKENGVKGTKNEEKWMKNEENGMKMTQEWNKNGMECRQKVIK